MTDFAIGYLLGLGTTGFIAWVVLVHRNETPQIRRIADELVIQAAFVRAASDVLDEETAVTVKERANELLDEYDVPERARWDYDAEDDP